ncbi:MAG: hypothetical protein E7623_05930 [Ruminococcaceae bacterium]|nr:hypothetical protein [Oscillospiraceae bacterium]
MEKFFNKLVYGFLYPTCTVFTLIILPFIILASTILNYDTAAIKAVDVFKIFAFSAGIGLSGFVLSVKKLNTVLKWALHFLCCALSFFLSFVIIGKYSSEFSVIFFLFVMFCVVYFAAVGVYFLINAIKKSNSAKKQDYKGIYK